MYNSMYGAGYTLEKQQNRDLIRIIKGHFEINWPLTAGLSSLGVPGVPWHTQILADQLTLFQPGGTAYAHLIKTDTPGFSDLPTALHLTLSSNFKF